MSTIMRHQKSSNTTYTSVEICAGAGGQALGLEQAGFEHLALIELDTDACYTLRENRPAWPVINGDVRKFKMSLNSHKLDLLAGGVPCPPYSIAGRQLGRDDERDLFPVVLRLATELQPRAIMIENVKGLLQAKFDSYRKEITDSLELIGYEGRWELLNARDFGVPQLRPRSVLVALKREDASFFNWPAPNPAMARTVGDVLFQSMASRGWKHAEEWAKRANNIAPTLVGGSKKHGGADLGPTRSKSAWHKLGVDAHGVADDVPGSGFRGEPRLTVSQAAIIQGFPDDWKIMGRKTSAYRQIGNAFPPPVAKAVAMAIISAWRAKDANSNGKN